MKISVIIPSYNTWPLIGKTLTSLQDQDYNGDYEIIVADCSTDGSDLKIAENFPNVNLYFKETRDYPGAARNRAITHASGDIIAMIDADAEASPGWLSRINANFSKDNSAVGFGGAIANANDDSRAGRIAHLLEFGGYTPSWPGRQVRMTPTCNLALKRHIFDTAEFLEDWFGNEDVMIAEEIKKMGGAIMFDPVMLVHHHTRNSWDKLFSHQERLGRDTGRTRYAYDLPGSWLTKTPGASYLVPGIKYLLLLKRVLGPDRVSLIDFLGSSWQVFRALNAFARGFRNGIRMERNS